MSSTGMDSMEVGPVLMPPSMEAAMLPAPWVSTMLLHKISCVCIYIETERERER